MKNLVLLFLAIMMFACKQSSTPDVKKTTPVLKILVKRASYVQTHYTSDLYVLGSTGEVYSFNNPQHIKLAALLKSGDSLYVYNYDKLPGLTDSIKVVYK